MSGPVDVLAVMLDAEGKTPSATSAQRRTAMRENVFVCDLCRARVEEAKWYLQPVGLYLEVYLPCSNPICNECREAVAAQIVAAVKSRLELRGLRDD